MQIDYTQATAQQIFDFVVAALTKQGRKSIDLKSCTCQYRSKNGDKCAAGHLIADSMYSPTMESKRWVDLARHHYIADSPHTELINTMQFAHDKCKTIDSEYHFDMEDFNRRFKWVADSFKLKME